MKNKIIISTFILVATLFTACNQTDYDPISVADLMGDSLTTTYTIAQLKTDFLKQSDAYSSVGSLVDLYTSDEIISSDEVVVSGYITSTDVEGNVYKYFTFQEDGANGQAMKMAVDASGLTALYNPGQHVWIRCNYLHIGNYGQAPQLGDYYVNTSRINTTTAGDTIYRIEPGRLPLPIAVKHIHTYGMPDPSVIKADTMTIAQIKTSSYKTLMYKLVCIKNAYFTGFDGDGNALTGDNLIFAPSTNGGGYPQLRTINDGTGEISIATSEYAKFASQPLPTSNYRGNITVIIGWYKNSTKYAGVWQLTLRSLGDLGTGFEDYLNQVNYN